MKRVSAVLLSGLIVMALTVVLYFTILDNVVLEIIHFVSLAAILLAEAVTTVYFYFANSSPRQIAAAVVTGLMVPFSVVLSIVYIVNFPQGYVKYIGLYCAAMLLANLIAFVLARFDINKSEEKEALQAGKSNMLKLRKLVMCILADPAAKPYEDKLRSLEEKLHFSNDSVIAAEDEAICLELLQLQEKIADPEFDCEQALEKLEKLIDRRKIMTSQTV